MIVAINYANDAYKKHQRINSWTARHIGKVDKVYSFSPKDIDADFYNLNKNILSYPRGNGLWLWKPYFIDKVMNELNDGDSLVYLDSGAFYIRKIHSLVEKLKNSKQDIMLFEIPLIECQWTKKVVFQALDVYTEAIRFSNQTMGIIIIIISDNSIKFIQKWLELCQMETLILPKEKNDSEDEFYIAHREDQSILSVLAKKEGIIPFSDPTDYGKFPNQYLFSNLLFKNNKKETAYLIKKTYFLLYRKEKSLKYAIIYFIKSILNTFGLRKINL
ncbi:hypothetical protein FACS189438_0480 [Bacteroidia bacterium]|nr:hypothetical protein FACS189438_0480 [Bacteroidia bacterium]